MHSIQDNTEQFSDLSSSGEDRTSSETDAWGDSNFKNQALRKIIQANKKIRLFSVLKNYGIQIPKSHATQTWSTLIQCPFPDHKDRSPSFGYNFRENRFNCLGCKRSGKAVEFIAAKEGKSKVIVAESILEHYADSEYLENSVEEEIEDPKVQELLFEMSESFRDALYSCKGDMVRLNNIEKIIWWFDMYIAIKAGAKNSCRSTNIDVEELRIRVSKAQDLIDEIRNS